MFIEILLFFFFWCIMSGAWHETMHCFEGERQIHRSTNMWLVLHPVPSLHYNLFTCDNRQLVALAGGLYTSFTCSILSICSSLFGYSYLAWVFLTLSFVQLGYGLWEGFYKPLKYRYIIYISIILIMLIVRLI